MPANSRLPVLIVMCVALHARNAYALPPVETSGKIASTVRLIQPARGTDTQTFVNTAELRANSYIWEPWFGNWQATGTLSRSTTDSDRETTANILSGDVRVNLFHRSHFPFSFFATLQDSRVEITNLSDGDRALRTLGVGVNQQYQDRENGIYYFAFLRHDEQYDLTEDTESVIDRLLLTASKSGRVHSFSAEISAMNSALSVARSDTQTIQFSGSYVYRPDTELTITNSASALSVEGSSALVDTSTRGGALGTQVDWQPEGGKLRVRGALDLSHQEQTSTIAEDETRDELRARASTRYEFNEEASVFAQVGYDHVDFSGQQTTTGFAGLSGTYRSKPIDWKKFSYTWRAGVGLAGERTQNSGGSSTTFAQNAALGHEVTRAWVPDVDGPLPIVFNAGQDVQALNETEKDPEFRVTHRATLSATRAKAAGSSYGQLSMLDIRSFGRVESNLFSVTASASHNQRLSRYRTVDFTASYGYNGSETDGTGIRNDNLTLELRYRDARLFDVSRLEFESRLRGTAAYLLASTDRDAQMDVEWDNRLIYRIGLLEVDARAAMIQADQDRSFLYTLSLIRRF